MMLFVDASTDLKVPVSSNELVPGRTYNVYLFLQNTDPTDYYQVAVDVWHGTFGIGLRDWTSGIVQPKPVVVPASFDGAPGVVAIRFSFTAPAAGIGNLSAKVLPNGPAVTQRVRMLGGRPGFNESIAPGKREPSPPRGIAAWFPDYEPT